MPVDVRGCVRIGAPEPVGYPIAASGAVLARDAKQLVQGHERDTAPAMSEANVETYRFTEALVR